MEIRFSRSWAFALAAVTLTAATAEAQTRCPTGQVRNANGVCVRRTSTTRIPVQKEAPLPPRVDTVYQTRTDTVTRYMRDTVYQTRYDTVTRTQTVPMAFSRVGGPYFGIGAGGTPTLGHLDNAQTGNAHVMAMVGWEQVEGPFGVRIDGTWNRLTTNDLAYERNNIRKAGEPTILTLGANLTLGLPINPTSWNNVKVYALGGGTYNRARYVAMVGTPGNAYYTGSDWTDEFGYQLGAGFNVGIGNAAVFFETRWVKFSFDEARPGFKDAAFIPVSAGFKF